jgi:aryl-alcohol dehydrogenase-like predicted oxidoreductase
MIPSIPIAGTDVRVSRVAFGCARIFGGSEIKDSAKLIEAALKAGIRHFDTAPSYGSGESEKVLGAILSGDRDVTITSKVGVPARDGSDGKNLVRVAYRKVLRPALSMVPGLKLAMLRAVKGGLTGLPPRNLTRQRRQLAPDEVKRGLDASLKALKRDRVDVFLIHEPDQFELTSDIVETFNQLKKQGMIGAYGLAFDRTANEALSFGSVVQARYSPDFPQKQAATRIFHGLLRHGWSESQRGPSGNPADYFFDFFMNHPESVALFSASSPHQIANLLVRFEGRSEQWG